MEVAELEERLRQAELRPDPVFFEQVLADDAIVVDEDGRSSMAKRKVVAAHENGNGPRFTSVEVRNMKIIDHGAVAVVTCEATYDGLETQATLQMMRVWAKKDGRWQIVAASVSK